VASTAIFLVKQMINIVDCSRNCLGQFQVATTGEAGEGGTDIISPAAYAAPFILWSSW
jgi:hypothetical protein